MPKFYEADTVDGVPVLINIANILHVKPYENGDGDYDMTKTTICHERFMFTSIDRNYNDVVISLKVLTEQKIEYNEYTKSLG